MVGDRALAEEMFVLGTRAREVLHLLLEVHDLPLGAIGRVHMDHPFIAGLDPTTREMSTRDGTVVLLMNAGPFHAAISRLSREQGIPLIGSSANRSNHGTKFRIEDIEPEILAIADIVIDHGPRKLHLYEASSTLLDLETLDVVRHGSCFEAIADVLERGPGVILPSPPPDSAVSRIWERYRPSRG